MRPLGALLRVCLVLGEVGAEDGVDTSVGLDEGRHGFPGCLRNFIAVPKDEEFSTLFILVTGYTRHYVLSIDCHFFGSHILKFVSLFR